MIPAALLPYLWRVLAVVGLVLAAWIGVKVHDHGIAVQAQAAMSAKLAQANVAALENTRRTEAALQSKFNIIQGAEDEKLQHLSVALSAARRLLDRRASRPAVMPPVTAATAACTGASLYRPDAEFLIGEAARADGIRIRLDDCEARYNAAREALKEHDHVE